MPLSASQIVADACSIAKCPGYLALGGRSLNLVLNDLVLHRNLKINLISSTIIVNPASNGPFTLEANYLRTYDLFYLVSGEPFFLNPCSLKELDQEPQAAGLSNYPYEWATDLSPNAAGLQGNLYVYPQSNSGVTLTHRYYLEQADIATPEASAVIPWFPDQDYLLNATAVRLMRITDDDRQGKFEADCERMLELHLMTEGDEQQVVKEVALDPRRFRVGGSNRPTKINPW
jgi:hypothetical protein